MGDRTGAEGRDPVSPASTGPATSRLGPATIPGFHGILVDRPDHVAVEEPSEPSCFGDLNLDQVLASMTAGREEYRLEPIFYSPLHDVAAVHYRHQILRDLEKTPVSDAIDAFAQRMRTMRQYLAVADKLRYRYQKERWFLDTVDVYCDAVTSLADDLSGLELSSPGLLALREYLVGHVAADAFMSLRAETQELRDGLAGVTYTVHIRGSRVTVDRYGGESDYSAEVKGTFAKFKQGAVKDYRIKASDYPDMDHIEARILELVASLHPDVFEHLDRYCARHPDFLDPTIGAFDREVQFYVAYLDFIGRVKSAGLEFCYPQVSSRSREITARGTFDLALATKLVPERTPVVTNDFSLEDPERILVVSGPNQGGKTTFARMFGQVHFLASLGLPVPGRSARLFLPDQVFAHFEREEDLSTLRGKLDDELVRIRDILHTATRDSVIIMNESFTSTTLHDALFLGSKVLGRIVDIGALCVCVTFVDELASLDESTVSMVAMVAPDDATVRTFKVLRKPADGLAYAAAIADKHGLGYQSLRRRIA